MLGDFRQAGGGDSLTHASALFIRKLNVDAAREFRKLSRSDFLRAVEDDISAWPCGHAAQNEKMTEVVEICVVSDRVAQIGADGFINAGGAFIAGSHECL